ncbi:MAG: alpha/beta hydrolase [Actinomycetota bacterium]|nr:alpha/beta hydrolase [Actinomycetota bacterium]
MHPSGLHVVRHHADAPGPPVVLVHGAPDRSKNFAHVVHQLSDLPVTIYDRRGYGKSLAAGEHGGGFHTHAADLIALLDDTPSIVVGQSAGGAIGMLAATLRPDLFLALGVWEPPMVPWMWWVGMDAWQRTMTSVMFTDTIALGEQFNRMILGNERWEQLAERTQELLRAEGEAFRADMRSQIEPYFDLADLTVPMVVGCGTSSFDETHRTAPHRLAARLGAELLVVDGADHFSHLSNPAAWVRLVRATVELAGCRAGGGAR